MHIVLLRTINDYLVERTFRSCAHPKITSLAFRSTHDALVPRSFSNSAVLPDKNRHQCEATFPPKCARFPYPFSNSAVLLEKTGTSEKHRSHKRDKRCCVTKKVCSFGQPFSISPGLHDKLHGYQLYLF